MRNKKNALRKGESHIQAAKDRFLGAVLDESWETPDQPVVTVRGDSAPVVIEYLYYQRGGWMPVMVGNDERPFNGKFALY